MQLGPHTEHIHKACLMLSEIWRKGKLFHGGTESFSDSFRHLEDSPELLIHFFSLSFPPLAHRELSCTCSNSISHSPGCLSPFELSMQPESCLLFLLYLSVPPRAGELKHKSQLKEWLGVPSLHPAPVLWCSHCSLHSPHLPSPPPGVLLVGFCSSDLQRFRSKATA